MEKKEYPNLKSFAEYSPEERRAMQSKGGKRSAEVQKERRKMKEQAEMILASKSTQKGTKKLAKELGISEDEIDNQLVMITGVIKKAMKGDVNAFNSIRELVGEKVQEVKVTSDVDSKVTELKELLEDE